MGEPGHQTPEQRARVLVDHQLRAAGWHVCDSRDVDLVHHPQTAVREVRMKRGHGQVDHLPYVDRRMGRVQAVLGGARRRSAGLRRALLHAAFTGRLNGAASDAEVIEALADA